MGLLHDYLCEPDSIESKQNLEAIKRRGIARPITESEAFDVTLELTETDDLGKVADLSKPKVTERVERSAYLKLVNVPSPLDIAGLTSDPTDGSLSFSLLDFNSLNSFQKFLSQTKNPI